MAPHPRIESFIVWALGRKLNPDGRYGVQCKDLADAYAEYLFGVPWQQCLGGVQGARQTLDVAPDKYWIRTDNNGAADQIPARGDLAVFGGDHTNEFGHIALTLEAFVNGGNFLQQDGFAPPLKFVDNNWYSDKPAHTAWLGYNQLGPGPITGWLTPRPEMIVGTIVAEERRLLIPGIGDLHA